jgi:hypothetical protein
MLLILNALKGKIKMSNKVKYYSIKSYEWLLPTGDASRILILYSIADDDQGKQNRKDLSIVIRLSRDAKRDAALKDETNKAKVIIAFIREAIKKAVINGTELPSEMSITSYDNSLPTNPDNIELRLGEWDKVIVEKKMGFLSS